MSCQEIEDGGHDVPRVTGGDGDSTAVDSVNNEGVAISVAGEPQTQRTAYKPANFFSKHSNVKEGTKESYSVIMKDLTVKKKFKFCGERICSHDVHLDYTETTFDLIAKRKDRKGTDIRETKQTPSEIVQCTHEERNGEVILHFVKKDDISWPNDFEDATPPPSPVPQDIS